MASGAATDPESRCEPSLNPLTEAALHGITRALASVGRAFYLSRSVLPHCARLETAQRLPGRGRRGEAAWTPRRRTAGRGSFGQSGPASSGAAGGPGAGGVAGYTQFADSYTRLVSITAAPMVTDHSEICDPMYAT